MRRDFRKMIVIVVAAKSIKIKVTEEKGNGRIEK